MRMLSGVGKMTVVIFSSCREGTWRGHAFKGWSLTLLENEVFGEFAEDNRLLAHTCIAHTKERTSALFTKGCLRARVIWPSSDRLQDS